MKLTQAQAAQMVIARGSATVDDLMPDLPGFSRQQVIKALSNARLAGKLVSTGRSVGECGNQPSVYRPAPQKQVSGAIEWKRYASVFHYGQGVAANT